MMGATFMTTASLLAATASRSDAFSPVLWSQPTARAGPLSLHEPRRPLVAGIALDATDSDSVVDAVTVRTPASSEAVKLKEELLSISSTTKRGFVASSSQRDRARKICYDLGRLNPTPEPASAYYEGVESSEVDGPTLLGKWTLVYTDAPDITSLDAGPFAASKLGRIGQECDPPMIKNVIEWRRPDWASGLPFSGGDGGRVIQKVCTSGRAKKGEKVVDLSVVGLDLQGSSGEREDGNAERNEEGNPIERAMGGLNGLLTGGPAAALEGLGPLELRGPLSGNIPFGRFEVLYLDDDMRIIKTGQNYLAVNVRDEEEWF